MFKGAIFVDFCWNIFIAVALVITRVAVSEKFTDHTASKKHQDQNPHVDPTHSRLEP